LSSMLDNLLQYLGSILFCMRVMLGFGRKKCKPRV
jgi:hypothetical protein